MNPFEKVIIEQHIKRRRQQIQARVEGEEIVFRGKPPEHQPELHLTHTMFLFLVAEIVCEKLGVPHSSTAQKRFEDLAGEDEISCERAGVVYAEFKHDFASEYVKDAFIQKCAVVGHSELKALRNELAPIG